MTSDTAYSRISRPAQDVFDFMAAPDNLSLWSYGTWNVKIDPTGLVKGASIKDGTLIFVRVDAHPDIKIIDYLIGSDPSKLQPRIFVRVIDGETLGGSDDECALLMTAIRVDDMDDERWSNVKTAHAFEITLIKSAIETGYDHRRLET